MRILRVKNISSDFFLPFPNTDARVSLLRPAVPQAPQAAPHKSLAGAFMSRGGCRTWPTELCSLASPAPHPQVCARRSPAGRAAGSIILPHYLVIFSTEEEVGVDSSRPATKQDEA